ncbi:fimbrial protein [Salmonella enterica subsp. diarizonae]|nr:fimbrial protein [Salmonella enterica subsp. diarizonae]
MKKLVIATLVMGVMASGVASANTGEVQFIGSVTDTTCNISPEVGGAIKNTIELGTMKTDGSDAQEVTFKLVPDSADCLAKTDASVGWQSAGFNTTGLVNMKGDATGAAIKLTAVNSSTANQAVTSNMQNITFGNGNDAIGAFEFKAQLAKEGATATPGTVISSAYYAVAYK